MRSCSNESHSNNVKGATGRSREVFEIVIVMSTVIGIQDLGSRRTDVIQGQV